MTSSTTTGAMALGPEPVTILYTNWRGETAVRRIIVSDCADDGHCTALRYGSTEWHPEPQWLLSAHDPEKGASRDFALSGIKAWGQEAVAAALAAPAPVVPEDVREAFEAAKLQELFVDGDKADVYTKPPGSNFVNEFEMVARCACGPLWGKRAVAIAVGLNWIGQRIAATPSKPVGDGGEASAPPAGGGDAFERQHRAEVELSEIADGAYGDNPMVRGLARDRLDALPASTALRMAEGCCSAVSPCSHQQRDPYSLCEICQKANGLAARVSEVFTPPAGGGADPWAALRKIAELRWSDAGEPFDDALDIADAALAAAPAAPEPAAGGGQFRVGRKVPQHVYEDDEPLFTARCPEQAERLVDLLNAGSALLSAPSEAAAAGGDGLSLTAETTPIKDFPNRAGQADPDDEIAAELDAAGIKVHRFDFLRDKGEVKTSVVGDLHGWSFKRAWRYWIAEGPGIELAVADVLHAAHPATVRVDGHCGCPSPRECFKGFAVGSYHVDSPAGLKGLADAIRYIAARAAVPTPANAGAEGGQAQC